MGLNIENIYASYAGEPVLENITVTLADGELVSLVGASGVGKTTLFHITAGLMQADSGSVVLDGEDITGQAGHVAYMLQKDLLLPYKTVMDNLTLPLVIGKVKKREAREMVLPYLSEFGLFGYEDKYPDMLSGGMRQRAAFLRTYMQRKKVMLLDEPFSAVDGITKKNLHEWYGAISKKHNLSTLLITHDIEEAVFLSDRVYVLAGKPGKIVGEISIGRGEYDKDFSVSEQFLKYKKYILDRL